MAQFLKDEPGTSRALLWWPDAALRAASAPLDAAVAQWAGDWGIEGTSSFAANLKSGVAQAQPRLWRELDEQHPGVRIGEGFLSPQHAIARSLWHQAVHPSPDAMSQGLAAQAWHALMDGLAGALPKLPASECASAYPQSRAWSGAVEWALEIAGVRVVVLRLDDRQVRAIPGVSGAGVRASAGRNDRPRGALAPLERAIGGRPVKVRVELEPTDCSLGALQRLQVGDVVTLRHGLEDPLWLASSGGGAASRLCRVHLGRQGEYMAVELASMVDSNISSNT
jgi:flagellar motor switch/type III secretory pathway protein FliN